METLVTPEVKNHSVCFSWTALNDLLLCLNYMPKCQIGGVLLRGSYSGLRVK